MRREERVTVQGPVKKQRWTARHTGGPPHSPPPPFKENSGCPPCSSAPPSHGSPVLFSRRWPGARPLTMALDVMASLDRRLGIGQNRGFSSAPQAPPDNMFPPAMKHYERVSVVGKGSFGQATLIRDSRSGIHYIVKEVNMTQVVGCGRGGVPSRLRSRQPSSPSPASMSVGLCPQSRAVHKDPDVLFSPMGTGATDGNPLAGKRRRLGGNRWRLERNRWRLAGDGGWRATDGGWRVTDGGWRVTDGGWGVTASILFCGRDGGTPSPPHFSVTDGPAEVWPKAHRVWLAAEEEGVGIGAWDSVSPRLFSDTSAGGEDAEHVVRRDCPTNVNITSQNEGR